MYILKVKQGDKTADIHCDNLIPLILAVKDQKKYYPYAQFEIWDGEDTCLYDCRYDEFKRAKAGWRIIHNIHNERKTEDATEEVQ